MTQIHALKRRLLHILCLFASFTLFAQDVQYRNYNTEDGLPSNNIITIGKNEAGYLIVETDRGWSRFNGYDFETIEPYAFSDLILKGVVLDSTQQAELAGLPLLGNKTLQVGYDDGQNSTWIGTAAHGLYFYPEYKTDPSSAISLLDYVPNFRFEYIGMNSKKIDSVGEKITVPAEYQTITIGYVSLDYARLGRINYQYKIEGIHEDWVDTRDTKAQFTSLPDAGTYNFLVRADRKDGSWTEPIALEMTFETAFYLTWWFRIGVAVLFLALFWAIIRAFYKRKLKVQALQTELSSLEGRALQSQMNPHFVFNSLNSIQSFIATGDTLNSEIYLAKFSALLRKTLNHSRESSIALSKEIENVEMYLELEKMRFGDRLNYTIDVGENVEADLIKIPPMLIQPFVENAIVHGISPKKEGGSVSISITSEGEGRLRCIITDDGVGRDHPSKEDHVSLGTQIVKKRLSLIGGDLRDHIKYKDLKDGDGNATGTVVELTIPV